MIKFLAVLSLVGLLSACGPQTDQQKEAIEFAKKCRATPALAECKEFKEITGGGPN